MQMKGARVLFTTLKRNFQMNNCGLPENWKPGKMQVPDYRIYKVEGIPELEYVRDTLAKRGLKDPWLRNHVWRYPPWYRRWELQLRDVHFAGIKEGFVAFLLKITADNIYYHYKFGGQPEYVTTAWQFFFCPPSHHGEGHH